MMTSRCNLSSINAQKLSSIKERMTEISNINLGEQENAKELEPAKSYKYLEVLEGKGIEIFRKECYRRVRAIFKTGLNAKNMIKAFNQYFSRIGRDSNIIN